MAIFPSYANLYVSPTCSYTHSDDGEEVFVDDVRDSTQLLHITNQIRKRLAKGFDGRGLKNRYRTVGYPFLSFDEACYLHPALARLHYVEDMTKLYVKRGKRDLCGCFTLLQQSSL